MKRKLKHKGGAEFDKSVPARRPSARLRPAVSADFGASITDDPVKLFYYALAFIIPFYIIKHFIL